MENEEREKMQANDESSGQSNAFRLIKCCAKGDIETATELLKSGVDPNIIYYTNVSNELVLITAENASRFSAEIVDDLYPSLYTPLFTACTWRNIGLVKLLTMYGANFRRIMNHVPRSWWSHFMNPLKSHWSSIRDLYYVDSVEVILQAMNKQDEYAKAWLSDFLSRSLAFVSEGDDRAILFIKLLLEHGADLKCVAIANKGLHRSSLDWTQKLIALSLRYPIFLRQLTESLPLLIAAKSEDVVACNAFLSEGSDITSRDDEGATALHIAVGNSDDRVTRFLIENGADVNAMDTVGVSPLMNAVLYGHEQVVSLLLAAGANSNVAVWSPAITSFDNHTIRAQDSVTSRISHLASPPKVRQRPSDRSGTSVDKGWSLMHIAAHRGYGKIIRLLYENGANRALQGPTGATSLDVAIENRDTDLSLQLLKEGYPFDPSSAASRYLLMQAMDQNHHSAVQSLLQANVDGLDSRTVDIYHLDWDRRLKMFDRTIQMLERSNSNLDNTKSTRLSHQLCPNCDAIISGQARLHETPCSGGLIQHMWKGLITVGRLARSCGLCNLVDDFIYDQMESSDLPSGVVITIEINRHGETRTDSLVLELETALHSAGQKRVGISHHPLRLLSTAQSDLMRNISSVEDNGTDSRAAQGIANHWLRTCIARHQECQTNSSTRYSPTRILDVKALDWNGNPKLVQDPCLTDDYIALSHRWGIEGLPNTTTANIDERLRSITMDTLSRTMREAISVVRYLGFRYLWIDALCIIQDSEEDWRAEASRMGSVFGGALCTLAVADSDNHSGGMFRKRAARCVRPFYIDRLRGIPYRERTSYDGEGDYYVFPATRKVHRGSRPKGTLDTRGWVLQEQLLSPRILYYGGGEIYWDCVTTSASESSPFMASLLDTDNSDEVWAFKLLRRTVARTMTKETLGNRIQDAWIRFIINYSARSLTKLSDKLIAIEGILSAVAAVIDDEPVAGMWGIKNGLWRQLTWWTAVQSTIVTRENPSPQSSYLGTTADIQGSSVVTDGSSFFAPSWSWLSVHSPVFYHNPRIRSTSTQKPIDFAELVPITKIIDVHTSKPARGNGICGTLNLSGPSFTYHLTLEELRPAKKFKSLSQLKVCPGRWMLDTALELPRDVECIVLAEDTIAKISIILCLVPSGTTVGSYQRVGLCHWAGLAHDIATFAMQELIEKQFSVV